MKQLGISLLLILACQSLCLADVTNLPAEHRKVIDDSSRFHEVQSTTNLPPAIVALCAGFHGKLAEPGQKWEATDAIQDPSLPRKRLIWAAVSDDYYVVHYEEGGLFHSFHVLIATLPKGEQKPTFVWRGIGDRLKDYSAFLGALRSGKLVEEPEHEH
jgi:hypothetical protein